MRTGTGRGPLGPAHLTIGLLGLVGLVGCGGGRSSAPADEGGDDGSGGGDAPAAVDAARSSLRASVDFGVSADGLGTVDLVVTVRDADGKPLEGHTVVLTSTGSGNDLAQPDAPTGANGVARGTLASTVPEAKEVRATVDPGADEVLIEERAFTQFVFVVPGTFFVRQDGDDGASGTSPVEAWRTIARGLASVDPGDTLVVGAGTYPESLDVSLAATADEPLRILADTEGTLTGDRGDVVIDAGGALHAWRFRGSSYVLLRGFCITGAAGGSAAAGIRIVGPPSSNVAIVDNIVFGCERGVRIEGGSGLVVEGNRISNQVGTGHGVEISGGAEVRLSQNLIYNNAGHGLSVSGAGNDVRVELTTLYLNGDDQVRVTGGGSDVEIVNNVITAGLARGLHFDSGSAATERHNLVWANVGGDFMDHEDGALAATSGSSDPLFISPAGGDGLLGGMEGADDRFHVDSASPVLDSGEGTATGTLLAFGGPLSGYTSRVDGVLDGSGSDGREVNVGFHYPAQTDPFEALAVGDGRVFFGREQEVQAVGRQWDEETGGWLTESKVEPANATIRWIETRVSPTVGSEELLAVLADDGDAATLFLRRWDGNAWSDADTFEPTLVGIDSDDSLQRGFDVEYEHDSGDALVVYADGTSNPRFRTLVGGAWSPSQGVFASPLSAARVVWVELVARPGTDELSLVYLDDEERLAAAVWDGEEWVSGDAPVLLDTQIAELRESKAFDAAYEAVSGDFLVAWGFTLFAEETRYAVKPAGATTFSTLQQKSTEAIGAVVRLAADPTSDRIVAAIGEGQVDDDVVGMVWDGSAWGHVAELDLTGASGVRDLSVSWVGDTGEALFVYRDAGTTDVVSWARWDTAGWKKQPDVVLPVGELVAYQAHSFPGGDQVMLIASNTAGELFSLRYDGTTWDLLNEGLPLGTQLASSSGPTEPFSIAFRR